MTNEKTQPVPAVGVSGGDPTAAVNEKRERTVAVRLSETEYAELLEYRQRCPVPEVPISILLRQIIARGLAVGARFARKPIEFTPKKIKHRASASRRKK